MEFDLLRWSAWAPGVTSAEAWQAWLTEQTAFAGEDAPDVSFMPPMQRRRLSRMARMGFQAMEQCLDDGEPALPIVFTSRHGELQRSHSLLQSLARKEPLSPKDFSLSVHNATTGLYSIFRGNREASTAIAAGPDSLAMGLLEAILQADGRSGECLLVWVEQPVPDFYRGYLDAQSPDVCLALRIAAAGQGGRRLLFRHGDAAVESPPASDMGVLRAIMALLTQQQSRVDWRGQRNHWTLEEGHVAA
ncbi:beta-ketoacyl synthase chain length factor [Natronospira bacteriovora]|uniref:Beta-ketoacyl synthase chain length factor n=1 Tax=Natronospira bacteriovora TaxID=3069753 RepID=A0ABU0W7J7_9GAMM|nr:beta-ketoacyl synthase chain length factor [Natronospira sp. AB-CW4]MDQ2069997.1 beta-ketoacyl synthase chain length factor [Natronospira sp. AB-CW4]